MRTSSHMPAVLIAALLCACALAAFAVKISDIRPGNYLTDLAGVVDATTADRINALCAEVDRKTGAQIAVVTVRSLDGQPIENYAVDLFKHLGVGRKDNRGVLLLLAPNDRRYRVEVGYGLEPVINDARAGDIGREMVPLLRRNDYSGAVALGVSRVAGLIAADSHITLEQGGQPPAPPGEKPVGFPVWAFPLGLFLAISILRLLFRGGRGGRRGRRGSGLWWMGPWMGGGGWGSGGGWGGGFGGSSGGFGGFGGGSSGGGGASGSW